MRYFIVFLIITIFLFSCTEEENLGLWDINTGWQQDSAYIEDVSIDTSGSDRIYEYSCTEIPDNTISVEGRILFDGEIPETSKLSVAITTKPPPGMPSCYFTVKPKSFPFGFRFTKLEKDSEVYIMAVLKIDGASLPIPKEGVDYYGDYGSTPIKLTHDIKDIEITLKLYKKE